MHPAILGLLLGVGAVVVYRTWIAPPGEKSKLFMQGNTQFWDRSQTGALQAALGALSASPTAIDRVWRLAPGAGGLSALALVRQIQARGSFATSTTNVADAAAGEKLVAEVLPAEMMAHPVSGGAAVLPVL